MTRIEKYMVLLERDVPWGMYAAVRLGSRLVYGVQYTALFLFLGVLALGCLCVSVGVAVASSAPFVVFLWYGVFET